MMKMAVVGDIHGCIDELKKLVDTLEVSGVKTFVFLGDLVHRGPDSLGVIRFLKDFRETRNCGFVKGNHEDYLISLYKQYKLNLSDGKPIAKRYAEDDLHLCASLSDADIDFLQNMEVALSWYWGGELYGAVHAGVAPMIRSLDAPSQDAPGKIRKKHESMMRTRYVRSGSPISTGSEELSDPFWTDVYDGRFGHIFYGHEPYFGQIRRSTYATGVDTACCYGGKLTAVVLGWDAGQTWTEIIQVDAKKAYCEYNPRYGKGSSS